MRNEKISWYVLIGDQKYGPYDYQTVVEMVQSGQVQENTQVWADHLGAWTRLSQLEEFSRDHIQFLQRKDYRPGSAFIKRKGRRVETQIPVSGHNSARFFEGQITCISESGALCHFNLGNIKVGETLKLKVQDFTVECEVVRRTPPKAKSTAPVQYAVRFLETSAALLDLLEKKLNAA